MNHRMLKRMRLSPRQRRAVACWGKIVAEIDRQYAMRLAQRNRTLVVESASRIHFDNCSFSSN